MLNQDLLRYIELHRSMGFKFRTQAILLRNFLAYAEHQGDRHISASRVLNWAAQAPSPPQRRNRLATVRRFSLAMCAEDRRHQVPPVEAFGRGWFKRCKPHIYTTEQINALVGAASRLSPQQSIRPATYTTLFSLLAATGLRISEALALDLDDITGDGLLVRSTKFKKNRLVPIHATTCAALRTYLMRRAHVLSSSSALFLSPAGTRPAYPTVIRIFLQLTRSIGLRGGAKQRGPRIHDLRHTFAVRSLEQCAGDAAAISRHTTALSTYLGHAHVSDTYWYLQATPLLMYQIAQAGEGWQRGDRS